MTTVNIHGSTPTPPQDMTVADVMTRSVVRLRSTDRLRSAIRTLLSHRLRGAPVELGGTMLGTVTLMDLVRALMPGHRRTTRSRPLASGILADAMSLKVDTVSAEATLAEALAVMDDRKSDRLLVTRDGVVVGVVTATDIAGGLAGRGPTHGDDEPPHPAPSPSREATPIDIVEQASIDSFPASDPPSYWARVVERSRDQAPRRHDP